jgi:hypothetical protein
MKLQLKSAELQLKNANLLTLDDSLDVQIDCLEGSLWITQDGDPRDVILPAGHSYRIDRTSRVMVFATADARLRISSQPAQRPAMFKPLGWLARLSASAAPQACDTRCALSS